MSTPNVVKFVDDKRTHEQLSFLCPTWPDTVGVLANLGGEALSEGNIDFHVHVYIKRAGDRPKQAAELGIEDMKARVFQVDVDMRKGIWV